MTARLLAAFALGILADLFAMGDAWSYSVRMRESHVTALGCALAALLVVPAILNFGKRRTIDVALAVLAGMTIAHTVVLIGEAIRDPASHDLWPFEYVVLFLFAMPALAGAAAGRLFIRSRSERS